MAGCAFERTVLESVASVPAVKIDSPLEAGRPDSLVIGGKRKGDSLVIKSLVEIGLSRLSEAHQVGAIRRGFSMKIVE
jgi:hypothetical protein